MAVAQNKQQLIDAITLNYRRLVADLATIPLERAGECSLEGHVKGTRMSLCDLLAYLIGWNLLVQRWCAGRANGQVVAFPEVGFKWNELGRLAQKFYADYAVLSYPQRLERLEQAHRQILALVQRASDGELYGAPWYEKYTLGRMIQFNTSSPYANARTRVRQWKRHNGLA